MKYTRKLTAGLLTVAMTASMAGCGGNNASSAASVSSTPASSVAETAKLFTGGGSEIMYIITSSYSNPFFKTEAESVSTKAEELGCEVEVVSHDDDATRQAELFDNAIADRVIAIICDSAGADATVAVVKRIRNNSISVFLVDHETNESNVAISQIVTNNYQGVKATVEEFAEAMGEKGEYAELLSKESDTDADMRSNAFHETIDQYPGVKMITQQTVNQEQTEAYRKVKTILQSNPNIKGIVCGNDTMAVGVAAATRTASLKGIAIVGVDRSNGAAEQIELGNMVGIALQWAALIVEVGTEQADQYLRTGNTGKDEKQLVNCTATTKDNVDKLKNFVYSG